MKTRGVRGGVLLTIEASDTPEGVAEGLRNNRDAFTGNVLIEVAERLPWPLIEAAVSTIGELGGAVTEVRPAGATALPRGETKIIGRTIRSGGKVESSGSIVVIGDVNSGAELVAIDDIIVLGTLRGVPHAGAAGNDKAVIWAQHIRSPQLRIGAALAQAGTDGSSSADGPEVAMLQDGNIVLKPWT